MKNSSAQNSQQAKLAIFVGDEHYSLAAIQLLSNIAKECLSKGLTFHILSEGDLQKDMRLEGFNDLKEEELKKSHGEITHVFKGREEFNERKFAEWLASEKSPRALVKDQIELGNYSEMHRKFIAQGLEDGKISGFNPEELRQYFEKNDPERVKLIQGSTTADGTKFDFDSRNSIAITPDQLLRVSLNAAMRQELVVPQIIEARKEKKCDVEIVMFGDAHLEDLIDRLKTTEYSQSEITAFSKNPRFIGPESIHPMAESGMLKSYDATGTMPAELEAKLSEVAAQKAQESAKEVASGLLKEVREFNQNAKEEDRKLINQFTEEGVDLLVNYYNTKYPERG